MSVNQQTGLAGSQLNRLLAIASTGQGADRRRGGYGIEGTRCLERGRKEADSCVVPVGPVAVMSLDMAAVQSLDSPGAVSAGRAARWPGHTGKLEPGFGSTLDRS